MSQKLWEAKPHVKNKSNLFKFEKHLSKKRNVVGYDIKAEFPKNPHIKVINDFSKNLNEISKEVLKKIKKIL